jgi:hypothetical protein
MSEADRRLAAAFLALALGLALACDAAYALVSVRGRLAESAARLGAAGEAMGGLEFAGARVDLLRAGSAARSARALVERPAVALGARVPWIGRDLRSLGALSEAAEISARAGLEAVAAADSAGVTEGGLDSLYSGPRVRVEALRRAEPFIARADALLRRARALIDHAPGALLGPVQAGLSNARSRLGSGLESVRTLSEVLAAAPGLVGEVRDRRYLLVFQALNEARGTGGLIGLYGVVRARGGALELGYIGDIDGLVHRFHGRVQAPTWFEHLYGPMGATRQWQQANVSPNFPAAAAVLLRMYERSTGERLDGVISVDPVALGYLTSATGPLSAPGLATRIGPDNAARVLLHDSYLAFEPDQDARDRWLLGLVEELWRRLTDEELDTQALIDSAIRSARERHLMIYARRPQEQQGLEALGLDGALSSLGPNVQMVFHNNAAANKIDYFLKRSIRTTIRVAEDGGTEVSTTLKLENTAPMGPASYLLGPGVGGDPPALNRSLVGLIMPRGSDFRGVRVRTGRVAHHRGRDEGLPAIWSVLEVLPGEAEVVNFRYFAPHLVEVGQRGLELKMAFLPQPSYPPQMLTVDVRIPRGYEIVGDKPKSLTTEEYLRIGRVLELRFRATAEEP